MQYVTNYIQFASQNIYLMKVNLPLPYDQSLYHVQVKI